MKEEEIAELIANWGLDEHQAEVLVKLSKYHYTEILMQSKLMNILHSLPKGVQHAVLHPNDR